MSLPDDPLAGRFIRGYRVERLIASSADARVYEGTQLSVQRKVALKVLSPELSRDKQAVVRFVQRARSAAKLNHPNLVHIHDVCQEAAFIFYSMEYIHGGSLADRVGRKERLDWRDAARLLQDAARALSYAEERNVVHGSIDPSHLLLTQDGRLKVLNLGLGRSTELAAGKPASAARILYGAPEVLVGEAADHRSDMYSAGCSIYHTLAGRLPFAGRSPREIARAKQAGVAASFRAPAGAPQWLVSLLASILSGDPLLRPPTFQELQGVLDRHLEPEPSQSAPGQAPERKPWRKGLVTAASIALALGVLGVLVATLEWPGAGPEIAVGPVDPASGRDAAQAPGAVPPPDDRESRPDLGEAPPRPEPVDGPAVHPEVAAERRALLALEESMKRWRLELVSSEHALREVEAIEAGHRHPAVLEKVKEYLEEIRARQENEALAAAIARTVAPAVEEGEFQTALESLGDLERRFPGRKARIAEERGSVLERAAAGAAAVEREVQTLIEAGKFREARDALESSEPKLPQDLQERIARAREEVARAEAQLEQLGARLEETEAAVRRELATGSLDRAVEALAALPAAGFDPLRPRVEAIRAEVELSRKAYAALVRAVESAAAATPPIEVSLFALPPPAEPERHELRGFIAGQEPAVSLRRGGRTARCGLLELDATSLRLLLARGEGGDGSTAPSPEAAEGTGLLLLHQVGPGRAWSFLVEGPELSAETRKHYRPRLEGPLRGALEQELVRLESRPAEPAARGTAHAQTTIEAVEKAAAWNAGMPYYPEFRERLLGLYHAAWRAVLESTGFQGLFHGEPRFRDGALAITYDFSSEDELKDFQVSSGSIFPAARGFKLQGECRLLRGSPFRNWVKVTAEVLDYDPIRPNINVALWTHDGDEVTSVLGRTSPATTTTTPGARPPEEMVDPADYFVFAVGYEADTCYSLSFLGSGQSMRTPCYAILAGGRGKRLHTVYSQDRCGCLGAAGMAIGLKGRQRIDLHLAPTGLQWILRNQRRTQLHDEIQGDWLPRLRDELAKKPPTGSVTLFTNGRTVHYGALRVEGELNPEWLEAESRRFADEKLGELESRVRAATR